MSYPFPREFWKSLHRVAQMNLGISGKSAIVLGASRGLGLSIAKSLADEGVNLLLVARNQARLDSIARSFVNEKSIQAEYIAIDISKTDAWIEVTEKAIVTFGKIDILVNITGGPDTLGVLDASGERYCAHFKETVSPIIDLTKSVINTMIEQRWGRIINVSSSGVVQPIRDLSLSSAVRSSLMNWSKGLSNEVAKYGITVNSVIPGRIDTERVNEIDCRRAKHQGIDLESVIVNSCSDIPMGRYGTVEEFSSVVTFLAGEHSGYITGACIRVDGGFIKSV